MPILLLEYMFKGLASLQLLVRDIHHLEEYTSMDVDMAGSSNGGVVVFFVCHAS